MIFPLAWSSLPVSMRGYSFQPKQVETYLLAELAQHSFCFLPECAFCCCIQLVIMRNTRSYRSSFARRLNPSPIYSLKSSDLSFRLGLATWPHSLLSCNTLPDAANKSKNGLAFQQAYFSGAGFEPTILRSWVWWVNHSSTPMDKLYE